MLSLKNYNFGPIWLIFFQFDLYLILHTTRDYIQNVLFKIVTFMKFLKLFMLENCWVIHKDDFFHVNDFNEGKYSLTLISILIFCWKKNFQFWISKFFFMVPKTLITVVFWYDMSCKIILFCTSCFRPVVLNVVSLRPTKQNNTQFCDPKFTIILFYQRYWRPKSYNSWRLLYHVDDFQVQYSKFKQGQIKALVPRHIHRIFCLHFSFAPFHSILAFVGPIFLVGPRS